jgi:hypothetical protein
MKLLAGTEEVKQRRGEVLIIDDYERVMGLQERE